MPHVLLVVWIHCNFKGLHQHSLHRFSEALEGYKPNLPFLRRNDLFFSEAATGTSSLPHVAEAILRDFKSNVSVPEVLLSIFSVILSIDLRRWSMFTQSKRVQQKVLLTSIAACRSVFFLADNVDSQSCSHIFNSEVFFLRYVECVLRRYLSSPM